MGNKNSLDFSNLEETSKEKSLHSFDDIILIKTTEKVANYNIKDIQKEKNEKGRKYKLKLYPTTLTLKNDTMRLDFSYYNIHSWATSKDLFCFNTEAETYYCRTTDSYISLEIAKSIKDICYEILERNKKSKLE